MPYHTAAAMRLKPINSQLLPYCRRDAAGIYSGRKTVQPYCRRDAAGMILYVIPGDQTHLRDALPYYRRDAAEKHLIYGLLSANNINK